MAGHAHAGHNYTCMPTLAGIRPALRPATANLLRDVVVRPLALVHDGDLHLPQSLGGVPILPGVAPAGREAGLSGSGHIRAGLGQAGEHGVRAQDEGFVDLGHGDVVGVVHGLKVLVQVGLDNVARLGHGGLGLLAEHAGHHVVVVLLFLNKGDRIEIWCNSLSKISLHLLVTGSSAIWHR